jgi:hypothetical protein
MSNTLYDEAIADAKKLRELAEKNAKQAIIEAVTPKIRSLIENQLISDGQSQSSVENLSEILDSDRESQNITESVANKTNSDVVLDETALGTLMEFFDPRGRLGDSKKSKALDALHESVESLGEKDQRKLIEITRKLREDSGTLPSDNIVIGQELNSINIKENSKMSRNDEVLYEIDLNDIAYMLSEGDDGKGSKEKTEEEALREIMAELDKDEGHNKDHKDEAEKDMDEKDMDLSELYRLFEQEEDLPAEPAAEPALDAEAPLAEEGPELPPEIDDAIAALEDAIAGVVGGAEAAAPEGEAPEGAEAPAGAGVEDLAETVEVDLDMLRSEIRRMRRLSEGEDKPKHEAGHATDEMYHMEGDPAEETYQMEGDGEGSADEADADPVKKENRKLRRAILNQGRNSRAMSSKLDEYRSAVVSLREQLTEMNLFNAKLLYVNKMLQNRDVSSSQRRSIIEALDSARSLREVKLLYKSLAESIGDRMNESAVRRNLGSASRATRQASSTSSQVAEVSRWATLAGINK